MTRMNTGGYENKLLIKEVFGNENYDIIALQETHANTDIDISLSGYHCIRADRPEHVKAKTSSGGLAILVKNCYKKFISIIKMNQFVIWVKLAANLSQRNKDIYLACIYVPPQNSPIYNRTNNDPFDDLIHDIANYSGKGNIMLCGDFNARCGNIKDYIEDTNSNTFTNMVTSEDLYCEVRNTRDNHTNTYGLKLIDLCISASLKIVNGCTVGDLFGAYTCYKYNGCSTVDYFIVDQTLYGQILNFSVLPFTIYSDHCKTVISLSAANNPTTISPIPSNTHQRPRKYIWNDQSKESFLSAFKNPEITNMIVGLGNTNNDSQVNDLLEKCTNIYKNVANNTLKIATKGKSKTDYRQLWFDKTCNSMRKETKKAARNINSSNVNDYYNKRREYKKLLRNKKKDYLNNLINEVKSYNSQNQSTKFWKTISKLKTRYKDKQPDIDAGTWRNYFSSISKLN